MTRAPASALIYSMSNRRKLTETIAPKSSRTHDGADLMPELYVELRKLGKALLSRKPAGQTLQATALVHEAYAKIVGKTDPGWDGRGHFFAAAAQAMREILVDEARRKAALKRGGDKQRVEMESADLAIEPPHENMLALNDALARLEAEDPRKGRIVMLKFFAGLNMEEIAAELAVSKTTIEREWRDIRAWLYKELDDERK